MSSPSPEVTMSDEDLRCGVCCNDYNRGRRMPRMLHCEHTFCAQCLTKLGINEGSICTVRCPVCRWITCVLTCHGSLWIQGGLWINTEIYDKLKQENYLETQKPNLETQKPKVSKPSLDAFKGLFKRQPQDQQSRLTAADGKIAASKEMRPCKRPM